MSDCRSLKVLSEFICSFNFPKFNKLINILAGNFLLKHQKTLRVTRSSFLCPDSGTGNGIMQCFDNKHLQKNYARTVIFLIVNLILDPGQVDNLIFNWYTLLYLTRVHI